jgi:ribosome-binding factor A
VAETIRHELAGWLMRGEVHDPRLAGASVTISEVRASRDLKHATAYVAVLGQDTVPAEVLAALNHASGALGGRLARALHLKYAPRLTFAADDRYEEAARIDALLRAARADRDAENGDDGT